MFGLGKRITEFSEEERHKAEIIGREMDRARAAARWEYREYLDDTGKSVIEIAMLKSNNTVHLPFPYEGESFGMLSVKKTAKDRQVFLHISPGIFAPSDDFAIVNYQADDGPAGYWRAGHPLGGDGEFLVFLIEKYVMKKIKRAKVLKLDAPCYNVGMRQFVFEPSGLEARFF